MKKLLSTVLVTVMVFALAAGTLVHAAASVSIESLDNIYVNGAQLFNGGADAWLAENQIAGKIQTIGIRGWIIMGNGDMPSSFGYKIDNGDPVKVADSVVYDQSILDATGNAYPNMRRDVFVADVSGVGLGEHTFTIAAWNEADEVAYGKSFTFTQELAPGETPPPPAPAIVANNLDDWRYWYGGTLGSPVTVFTHGDIVGFHIAGWFGYNYETLAIGYRINGVETFVDGALRTPEQAVKDIAGAYARRYDMDGSFAGAVVGANDFDIIVKLDDDDQTVVDLFANIPTQIMPTTEEAVYFYDPSSYTTGYWTGPNAGFPDGSDIQIALTATTSFDGVFMFAYASPAPTPAVMNINLYDKDDNLLETVTQTFNGDAYAATKFSKVYPAGDYTLQYVFADGGHFVLGSGTPVGQTYTIGGICNNQYPASAPTIALLKAELPQPEPSVSTGNAALDEFQYDGTAVGSGSLYKWINNPDNREEIDFEKGAVSEIYFRGWAQLTNPVVGFGYVLDGGEVVTDPSFVQDRAAELANASFENAQGYTVTVPVADLAAGEHTIKIVAIDEAGAAVEIIKTKEEVDYPIALTFTVSEQAVVSPAELIKANLDIFTLSNCNLSVAGWAGANLPANNLGYKVDDGEVVFDGIVFANFNTPAEGDTIKSLAGENAFRFKTENDIALDLEPGEHTITLVMRVSDGTENYIVEMKSKTFTVTAEPDPAILKNMSFNTVWVDGVQVCDIGDAFEFLNANPIVDASAVGFRGWAQIGNSTIVAFGYSIDGGEPVCDAAYTQDRPDVRGAVGGTPETTNGFCVSPIDVSGLAAGDHTIAVVVKAADDTYVTIVTIPVTVSSSETPSVSTGNAALDEFKYDGVDVGSGSLYKWINNPDNREEIDFEKGAVSEIYFRGWAQLTNPVVGFGYVLDGGEVVTDPSFVQDRAAELANASFENAQGYTVTVPVADLAAGEHTVKIVAIDEAGNAVEIIKTKEEVDYPIALTFTVKGEEPSNHEIAGKSFDWYARNGAFISTNGKVDQFVDEGTGIVYLHCNGDVVGFMGWAALKDEAIDHFAYAIDGGELVTDENGMFFDRAAELAGAGIVNGYGFWIVFDYTALEDGLHSVAFYAVAADGTPVEIFSYNFSVYDVDDFTWLYDLSAYSTGFWAGPNCGRPTGDIAVTFETPNGFSGVFTAFFADNVPGALVRVDLYDEEDNLLESVEQKFVHNDNGIVKFSKAYAPGVYTVDYVYIGETGHFVLGSGPATEIEAVVSGDNGTNEDTLAAPSIALLNAEVPTVDPAELIKNNFDIFDLSNGVLTVQGWAGANYPANNLGYKIDGGEAILDGVEFANFNTPAEGDTIKSLAGENAFRYKTRGTGIALDLEPGEHTITIVMRVNDGTDNHIVEMGSKKFTVTGLPDPAVLKNFSFNTVWADDAQLCDVGDALAFLKGSPIPSGTEKIGLRGWAWIGNSEIDAFGYKIDDGEPVCYAAFTQERADVQAAVGQTAAYANGFNIQGIDVSDLDAGDHIITVVVKAKDGTFVEVVKVPYTVVSAREDSKSTGNAALDEFMYDGVDIAEGSKYIWINNPENRETIDFIKGQVKEIYFRGWAQLNNPISGFGYIIDDGEVVSAEGFVQNRTEELANAGFGNAQGYTVVVPVEDLEPGEHTIKIVAIDDMGVAVEIIKTKNEVDYPIALTFTVGEETPKFALGDVNMDGEVNNKDVVVLFRYVSETKHETELPLEVADMNNDGAIDNKDVVLLFRKCSAI